MCNDWKNRVEQCNKIKTVLENSYETVHRPALQYPKWKQYNTIIKNNNMSVINNIPQLREMKPLRYRPG